METPPAPDESTKPKHVYGGCVLSNVEIKREREIGNIAIEPFHPQNVSTSSYDVTLGENYFVESKGAGIYNPYNEDDVYRVWGQNHRVAMSLNDFLAAANKLYPQEEIAHSLAKGISPTEKIIPLAPGETILAHTQEFIGGTNDITTMMKARSSMGRNFIEVCKCAGWGDVGYVNRWTMEITNNSRYYTIPLVVGRRIAQIVFFRTGAVKGPLYGGKNSGSKYQNIAPSLGVFRCHSDAAKMAREVEVLEANWRPADMLPKLYLDRK